MSKLSLWAREPWNTNHYISPGLAFLARQRVLQITGLSLMLDLESNRLFRSLRVCIEVTAIHPLRSKTPFSIEFIFAEATALGDCVTTPRSARVVMGRAKFATVPCVGYWGLSYVFVGRSFVMRL